MRCTPGVFFIVAQRSSRCPYTLLLIELPTPVVLYTPIRLYTNKGGNEQRSQATTSSVSGLKKIYKIHTFKQSLLPFAIILIYLSDEI